MDKVTPKDVFAANRDRASRNFLARCDTARSGEFWRKPAQKRKARREADAIDSILNVAMKIDDFCRRKRGLLRNSIEIEGKFSIVANRDFNQAARCLGFAFCFRGSQLSNLAR